MVRIVEPVAAYARCARVYDVVVILRIVWSASMRVRSSLCVCLVVGAALLIQCDGRPPSVVYLALLFGFDDAMRLSIGTAHRSSYKHFACSFYERLRSKRNLCAPVMRACVGENASQCQFNIEMLIEGMLMKSSVYIYVSRNAHEIPTHSRSPLVRRMCVFHSAT